ncbi:hypothetical protein N9089_04170 [Crocinitomicaceae bacterium]|nr:hypothetical protein [Crocinitomicaceae bacterium]
MSWITKSILILTCGFFLSFTRSEVYVENLENTRWYIMVWDTNIHPNAAEMKFAPNGELQDERYISNGNEHKWSSNGNEVEITINDAYVTYTGKLTSRTTMIGHAKNVNGVKWKWFAKRID